MKTNQFTDAQMEQLFNEMENEGLALRLPTGDYVLTPFATREYKRREVLMALLGPDGNAKYALTFSALVHMTSLEPFELTPVLAELVQRGEVIDFSFEGKNSGSGFSLPDAEEVTLLGSPNEKQDSVAHANEVHRLKLKVQKSLDKAIR